MTYAIIVIFHLFYEILRCRTLPIVLILLVTPEQCGVHQSYSDPWVTDEILD